MSLTNFQNWQPLDSGDIVASTFTTDKGQVLYVPIVPQEIAVTTDTTAIAIFITTVNPKSTWKNGGAIGVNIFTGLANNSKSEILRSFLALNKVTLIVIPSYARNKSFTLFVPKWFRAVSWTIWEYTGGDVIDNIGKLDKILSEITTN